MFAKFGRKVNVYLRHRVFGEFPDLHSTANNDPVWVLVIRNSDWHFRLPIWSGPEFFATDTIRPRLEAIGADLKQVHVIEAVRTGEAQSRGFSITADLAKLEAAVRAIPGVRLVTVDPITAYLGGTDTRRTSDVRAALGPLQGLAAQYGVAVVAVSHLNKAAGGGKSVNAVTGSGAFVCRCKSVISCHERPSRRR